MGKDIFISYRREGGEHLALLIYYRLRYDGYSVFLDVESLRSGKFDEALFDRIREAKDFVLILPPQGLDRCSNPEDWVRQEIEFAISEKKNIIPVMMDGFDNWPEDLPETMAPVTKYNGLKNHQGYFEDLIRKLESSFLSSAPRMQAGPAESVEDDSEVLKKCQRCGSDRIVCEDPLPMYLFGLRLLRRVIQTCIVLTPIAYMAVYFLCGFSEEDVAGFRTIGLNLEFLLNSPFANTITLGSADAIFLVITEIVLILLGYCAYKYTETPVVLTKENASRDITVICKHCDTKRRIRISSELLPVHRNEKMEKLAGITMSFVGIPFLTVAYSVIMTTMNVENGASVSGPAALILAVLVLGVGYLISQICGYLNVMPEKLFLQYLKKIYFLETEADHTAP